MGLKKVVKYLIEHGAMINKRNRNGDTPLKLYKQYPYPNEELLNYLIENGAEI